MTNQSSERTLLVWTAHLRSKRNSEESECRREVLHARQNDTQRCHSCNWEDISHRNFKFLTGVEVHAEHITSRSVESMYELYRILITLIIAERILTSIRILNSQSQAPLGKVYPV